MRALFLADAHLRQPTDPNYRTLLEFLAQQCGRTDLLVLLGDIFEFWIGKNKVPEEHKALIEQLEKMTRQGTRLVYVEGNHDFHLGPVFTSRLNCQVLPDGGSIHIDGKSVFLAHGDLANPQDTAYRYLRNFLRSSLIRTLIRILPDNLLMAIASRASHESRKGSGDKQKRWPAKQILKPYAEQIIAAGHQAVITGHYHEPFHEKLGDGELIALGDWISQFSYGVYQEQSFKLETYSPAATSTDVTG